MATIGRCSRPTAVGVVLTAMVAGLFALVPLAPVPPAVADRPEPTVLEQRFRTSDGVELQTTLTSQGPLRARPTVVEFSPYGDDSQTLTVGKRYNFLLVQIRGTGDSDGRFDALGPRSQRDVVEVLRWACRQPFSNGRLALNGFSASAIVLYNSWHRRLPCVEAAILKSGTHELYRDLLVPGGIQNLVPGVGVLGMIGAPAMLQGPARLARDPLSAVNIVLGLADSGIKAGLTRRSLDGWWRQRGWRGDANDIPVLMVNGFFDVESRGAFQAYRALRDDGAHLLMAGGHDGVPDGTDGGAAEITAWLDHHVRGVANGVERHPRVQLLLAKGDRIDYLRGEVARYRAADWPVPGTRWVALGLDARRSGTALSLNDGALRPGRPPRSRTQAYAALPTLPTASDVPTAALIGSAGLDLLSGALPLLSQGLLSEVPSLTYTTGALADDVTLAGPLSLELPLRTSTPGSGIWAVLSDVATDGSSHPLAVGRLSTSYPDIVRSRSLRDRRGRIVQPYGDFAQPDPAKPGEERDYRVEMWPVGNRFEQGHRIRLTIAGTSLFSLLSPPALHTVRVGGRDGARLLVPVLPGSKLRRALSQ